MRSNEDLPARERLLQAAAALLAKSAGGDVSTRQITQMAGVKAPTLYHHFRDKEALFDAVVASGFEQYLAEERDFAPSGDPLEDLRRVWDRHVQFGLEHPSFYLVMFGNIRPERRPALVADAEGSMKELLEKAAIAGSLRVSPQQAARSILAANVGVTLMLISAPETERDLHLSEMTREAVISAVQADGSLSPAGLASAESSVVVAAIALNAALEASNPEQLSSSELKLFLEWLHRISSRTPGAASRSETDRFYNP